MAIFSSPHSSAADGVTFESGGFEPYILLPEHDGFFFVSDIEQTFGTAEEIAELKKAAKVQVQKDAAMALFSSPDPGMKMARLEGASWRTIERL